MYDPEMDAEADADRYAARQNRRGPGSTMSEDDVKRLGSLLRQAGLGGVPDTLRTGPELFTALEAMAAARQAEADAGAEPVSMSAEIAAGTWHLDPEERQAVLDADAYAARRNAQRRGA